MPREVLERIADAAVVWAPSAGFSQGLRIVVVTDPGTRRRIATAAKEDELAAQGRRRWKAAAPVHMIVLTREEDYHDRYRQQDKLRITGGREIEIGCLSAFSGGTNDGSYGSDGSQRTP